MKEIGEIFKEKREEIGLTEEEAANDLNITIPQLENLEDGKKKRRKLKRNKEK